MGSRKHKDYVILYSEYINCSISYALRQVIPVTQIKATKKAEDVKSIAYYGLNTGKQVWQKTVIC